MEKIKVKSILELSSLAKKLSAFAQGIPFFTFEGEIGAGKTTFISAFCKFLGVTETISSPTFSIINQYQGAKNNIYHFDFYRLKHQQEAYDIGYEDYFFSDSVCLIEWPSKVADLLPEKYVQVCINVEPDGSRTFIFNKIQPCNNFKNKTLSL